MLLIIVYLCFCLYFKCSQLHRTFPHFYTYVDQFLSLLPLKRVLCIRCKAEALHPTCKTSIYPPLLLTLPYYLLVICCHKLLSVASSVLLSQGTISSSNTTCLIFCTAVGLLSIASPILLLYNHIHSHGLLFFSPAFSKFENVMFFFIILFVLLVVFNIFDDTFNNVSKFICHLAMRLGLQILGMDVGQTWQNIEYRSQLNQYPNIQLIALQVNARLLTH